MAYSHNEVIKTKMTQLANVTTKAEERITPQILSVASRDLQDNLGGTDYQTFVDAFDVYIEETFGLFDAKSFDELSDDEKYLRNLIFAEAYFGLYHLAIALKKLVKGAVNVSRESAGAANIVASAYDDIIANADNYREQALNSINFALGVTEDEDEDTELHVDGTFGVFVT